jgi:phosphatidate cytidylyltransferase
VQNNGKKNSVLIRHLAAAVGLPAFIAYIYYLPPFPYFLAFLIIVGMLAMRELFSMYRVRPELNFAGTAAGGFLMYVFCRYPGYTVYALFIAVCTLVLIRLMRAEKSSGMMSDIGPLGIGFLYIAVCLSFHWFLREIEPDGLKYTFVLYFSVWGADSFAFYVGTYMGKNKLCPSISPKKTVEGAIGGLLGGMLGVVLMKYVFDISGLSIAVAIAIGAVMGVTSLTGDLVESTFKRDAGVKDSGGLIPGHGGVFDRIDGTLISGAVLYFIVRFI